MLCLVSVNPWGCMASLLHMQVLVFCGKIVSLNSLISSSTSSRVSGSFLLISGTFYAESLTDIPTMMVKIYDDESLSFGMFVNCIKLFVHSSTAMEDVK